jgi:hypothetical protein
VNTKSEALFEEFLHSNGARFSRIEEVKEKDAKRPDYIVEIGDVRIMFEVKQLGDDEDAERAQLTGGWSSTPGAQLRQRITRSKKQIQFGADQGIPAVLLVYNNTDPIFQLRGTDEFDFRTAMYGELTMLIDTRAQEKSEFFHGRKKEMQESKNTSFSAVGHLCSLGGTTTVTLWENTYAKVKIPFEQLAPCFAVRRVEINSDPLSFSKGSLNKALSASKKLFVGRPCVLTITRCGPTCLANVAV